MVGVVSPKLKDHPLSDVQEFIQYIRSYPLYMEAVSIRKPRTRHDVVTVVPLNMAQFDSWNNNDAFLTIIETYWGWRFISIRKLDKLQLTRLPILQNAEFPTVHCNNQ
jgi:hypothetical protein